MNCRKVQSLISAYVDCELSGMDMLAIRHHLSDCDACNSEFQSVLLIKRTLGALSQRTPSPELAAQICIQLGATPVSTYSRALQALRMHFAPHPTRLSLTAVSVGLLAALLVMKPGDDGRTRPVYNALRPMQYDTMVGEDPINMLSSTQTVSNVSYSVDARPDKVTRPWGLSSYRSDLDDPTGHTRVLLTSY